MITVKCPVLQVQVPGFSTPKVVDNVVTEFSLNLTACQLKVQSAGCGSTFNSLPDGVYIVKYSVSPNDLVYVEYNHLRITKSLIKIKNLYCELDMGACEPTQQVKNKLEELREIQDFLMAAKAKVESCRESSKGIELYKYATAKLAKLKCKMC